MKRIFTLALTSLLLTSAYADKLTVLSCGLGTPGRDEPQLVGLGISPDGTYVCGAIEQGAGIFTADRVSGKVNWQIVEADEGGELRHIDNNGMAIGFTDEGITYDFSSEEVDFLDAPEGYRFVLGEALTNDGTLFVGSLVGKTFATEPVYSTDRVNWHPLPFPSDEEMGDLKPRAEGGAAKFVSGDGRVILGTLGSFTIPTLWVRNDAGEYEPDFFPGRYVRTDESDESKPLLSISAMYLNLSNNGKYASMLALIYDDEQDTYRSVPVVYDTETKELKIYKTPQPIDLNNEALYPSAICDDGTFIGTIGKPFYGSYGSFIMPAGEEVAQLYTDAFPAYAEKFKAGHDLGNDMPTGISADGRYLLGYIYYCEDYNDSSADAYNVTYIIDTEKGSGVDGIAGDSLQMLPEAVYTLDGRRVAAPVKGVNIIRMTDGTVRKVVKK